MQDKNKKALDILSDQIIYAVKTICSKLDFDRTYTGIISSINVDGYIVKYNGTEIKIKTTDITVYKKNDSVTFCIPSGNKRKAFIIVNNNNGGGGGQTEVINNAKDILFNNENTEFNSTNVESALKELMEENIKLKKMIAYINVEQTIQIDADI